MVPSPFMPSLATGQIHLNFAYRVAAEASMEREEQEPDKRGQLVEARENGEGWLRASFPPASLDDWKWNMAEG